jgi:exodeoxyribonuclease V beta subunit
VSVGTFVHRVLEATDFATPDLAAELNLRVAEVQAYRPVEIGDPATVVAGLQAAIETPLDGYRLRDLARADRLDEVDFELPLVGGDTPTSRLALDAIAEVLREHGADLPTRLDDPVLRRSVRGYVTGSIDLVARTGERYTVVDYKTNWLAAP